MNDSIVNLTPHGVTLLADGREPVTVPPSGQVARVAVTRRMTGIAVGGVPVAVAEHGAVQGLPAERPGTSYIVSALVRQAVPYRLDVFSPADLVRDAAGNITGCRGLDGNA